MPAFQASDASSILAARTKENTHSHGVYFLWHESVCVELGTAKRRVRETMGNKN